MKRIKASILGVVLSAMVGVDGGAPASAQQQPATPPVIRTDLLKQVLPPGNFREVQAAIIELRPGATAPRHRHDVAVLAYVVEGVVENQFDGGATHVHKTGEAWWEAPGTVHDVARNASTTARARLLVVYVGEEGKAPDGTSPVRWPSGSDITA